MTGDAGTPLTAKWQIIELDEAQGIGSVEIEDGFTLRHEISFHFGDESDTKSHFISAMNPSSGPDNDDFFSNLLVDFAIDHEQASPCSFCRFVPANTVQGHAGAGSVQVAAERN